MSNQMSSSKSRWKGALLAAVAGAAVSPMMAHAQTPSMNVYLGVSQNGNVYKSNAYIDPRDPVTINVYAQVSGAAAPSATSVYGLQYLYYNVGAQTSSGVASLGNVSNATLDTNFGGTNFPTGSITGNGAQAGNYSGGLITTAGGLVVGDPSNLAAMAKPRAATPVWNTGTSASDQVVGATSVTYTVESLTYTPAAAAAANPSAPGAANVTSFTLQEPTLPTNYAPSNYFASLTSTPTSGSPAGASNTSTAYTVSSTPVTLTYALPGDATLDGTVGFADLAAVIHYYGQAQTAWADGNFDGAATIDFQDLSDVIHYYNQSLGGLPSSVGAPAALLADPSAVALLESVGVTPVSAVPEPTSVALLALAGVGLLGRRRRA